MKAAQLQSDLLMRKGAAAPMPGVEVAHRTPVSDLFPESAERTPGPAKTRPRGPAGTTSKRDRLGRVRISLRLDPHRHLRLRLVSAYNRMSQQETLIAALDAYLGEEMRREIGGDDRACLQTRVQDREPAPDARNQNLE